MLNVSVEELMAKLKTITPYTAKEIQNMIDEETGLRTLTTTMQKRIDAHNQKTLALLHQYVENFGKDQKYRLNTTKEQRAEILKELENAFWSRSLLRALYGAKLGAFAIEFKTSKFNLETVFSDNQIQFHSQVVRAQEKINEQRRMIMIALQVMDKRDDKILAAETSFFNRILSGITFIRGEAQLAQVNVEVLKLLYADMAEEGVLSNEGYHGMRRHYQTRYYTGISQVDVDAIKARAKDWRESNTVDLDTIRGTFTVTAQELKKYIVNVDQANKKRAIIDAFSTGSETIDGYEKNADEL